MLQAEEGDLGDDSTWLQVKNLSDPGIPGV